MEKRSKSKSSLSKTEKTSVPKNDNLEKAWEDNVQQNSSMKERKSSRKNSPKPQSTTKKSLEKSVEKSSQKNSKKGTPISSQKKPAKSLETQLEEIPIEPEDNNEEFNNEIDIEGEQVDEGENNMEEENNDMDDLIDDELIDDIQDELENNGIGMTEEEIQKQKEKNIQKALEFKASQEKKGVVYLSSIPPYMKVSQLRKLFGPYDVERIYLTPEEEGKRKFRVKTGGNKRRKYTEGWMEFKDKKVAKYVAMVFNNQKIGGKRRSFYTEDVLNLKYLPKFKWENLTEKINYDLKMRKEKMRNELALAKKQHDFYLEQVEKGKKIMGIKKHKDMKRSALEDIEDVLKGSVDEDEKPENEEMKASFDGEKDRIRRIFKQKKPKMH